MKNRSIILLTFLYSISLSSQAYMTAGGIRIGTDWGLTVQQRLNKNSTIEAIIQSSLQREEVMVTALAERHYPLVARGINIYAGGGLHKGWIDEDKNMDAGSTSLKDPFGLTLIAGAEMTIGRLNISYDFKPAINVVGGEKNFYTQTGVSARYVFLTNKVYKKKQKEKRKKKRKEEGKGLRIGDKWKFWEKIGKN